MALADTSNYVNAGIQPESDTGAPASPTGKPVVNYAARGGPTTNGAQHLGGYYDTGLDSQIGQLDNSIASTAGALKGAGGQTDPKLQTTYNNMVQQRQQLNTQRWSNSFPWIQQNVPELAKMIQSGQISAADLAGLDITELQNPTLLMQHVQDLMTKKAASASAGPVATGAAPGQATPSVTAAGDAAQSAMGSELSSVMDYANSALDPNNPNTALAKFDAATQQQQNEISSTAAKAANQAGGAAASALAAESGAANKANAQAQRGTVAQDTLNNVNSFINQQLTGAIDQGMDLSTMDTQQRLNLQGQSLSALSEALKTAMGTGDANAQTQIEQVDQAIAQWQADAKQGIENTSEMNRIIGLSVGLLMGAGGAALATMVPGGQIPGMMLGSAGINQIVNSTKG